VIKNRLNIQKEAQCAFYITMQMWHKMWTLKTLCLLSVDNHPKFLTLPSEPQNTVLYRSAKSTVLVLSDMIFGVAVSWLFISPPTSGGEIARSMGL